MGLRAFLIEFKNSQMRLRRRSEKGNLMSDEWQNSQNWWNDITERSTTQQLRGLRFYNEMFQFASEEATRYTRNLTQLTFNYYSSLATLNRNLSERFFNLIMQQSLTDESKQEDIVARQIDINLRGKLGSEIVGVFTVENDRADLMHISFLLSDFTDSEGMVSFGSPIRLEPLRFTLQHSEEREVKLTLPLLPQLFEAGKEYVSSIVVQGYDNLRLQISVYVDEQVIITDENDWQSESDMVS
jgi:hypothetical protein